MKTNYAHNVICCRVMKKMIAAAAVGAAKPHPGNLWLE